MPLLATVLQMTPIYKAPGNGYRYFRLYGSDWRVFGSANPQLTKVEFFDGGIGGTKYPAVSMTGPSAPSPLVARGSAEEIHPAWQAFDDNSATVWMGPYADVEQWIEIDLGFGNEIQPDSIRLTSSYNVPGGAPDTIAVKASNTGAFAGEEVTLVSASSIGWSSMSQQILWPLSY
ncbi:MAG: hypothetical protein RIB84_21180 [Sneathiellaceae bacterium]